MVDKFSLELHPISKRLGTLAGSRTITYEFTTKRGSPVLLVAVHRDVNVCSLDAYKLYLRSLRSELQKLLGENSEIVVVDVPEGVRLELGELTVLDDGDSESRRDSRRPVQGE